MLPETREVEDLRRARTNADRAGVIGRARLTLDQLAEANIAERYAIAADRGRPPT